MNTAKELIPIIHHVLCEEDVIESNSLEDQIVRNVMNYLEHLPTAFSGFHRSAFYEQLSELTKKIMIEKSQDIANVDIDQLTLEIGRIIEEQLHALSGDTALVNTNIQWAKGEKKENNFNSFSIFNFDDLPPLEALSDILEDIDENITSSIAWERLLTFDYHDLLEHPQWLSVIETLKKGLSDEQSLKEKALLTVYSICFRFLQAFNEYPQCGDLMSVLADHFVHLWTSISNPGFKTFTWSKLSEEVDGNIIWLECSQKLSRLTKAQLSLFNMLWKTYITSQHSFSPDTNNRLTSSFVYLLSNGMIKFENSSCPMLFTIAGNECLLNTVTAMVKSCDPFVFLHQDICCNFSTNLQLHLMDVLRYGKITKAFGHSDFHCLCVGLAIIHITMSSKFPKLYAIQGIVDPHSAKYDSETSDRSSTKLTSIEVPGTNQKYSILVCDHSQSSSNWGQIVSNRWKLYASRRHTIEKNPDDGFSLPLTEVLDDLLSSTKHLSASELTGRVEGHWVSLVDSFCEYFKINIVHCSQAEIHQNKASESSTATLVFKMFLNIIISLGEKCGVSLLFENSLQKLNELVLSFAGSVTLSVYSIDSSIVESLKRLLSLLSMLVAPLDDSSRSKHLVLCQMLLRMMLFNTDLLAKPAPYMLNFSELKSRRILSHYLILSQCRSSYHCRADSAMQLFHSINTLINYNASGIVTESDCTLLLLISSQLSLWSSLLDKQSLSTLVQLLLDRLTVDPFAFENQFSVLEVGTYRAFPLVVFEMLYGLIGLHYEHLFALVKVDEYLEGYHERLQRIPRVRVTLSSENVVPPNFTIEHRLKTFDFLSESSIGKFGSVVGGIYVDGERVLEIATRLLSPRVYALASLHLIEVDVLMRYILQYWFVPFVNGDVVYNFAKEWVAEGFSISNMVNFLVELTKNTIDAAVQHDLVGLENIFQHLLDNN